MIGSFRNFAKTKFAGLLVFIMIIPFVFWGMGGMFSSGNTNNLAKINKTNISTSDFFVYLDEINIAGETIRNNLENNIIEELLQTLISTKLLDLEIESYKILLNEETLLKKIKNNKNFFDDTGKFQRIKYEKFLLENNISAPLFEQRLKKRESQKNLFDYIGAGTTSPNFLVTKLFNDENRKLNLEFFNLENFYKKKNEFSEKNLNEFLFENKDKLKIEYIDFKYTILNPTNLVGVDEFNQAFFDKIDQIEIDISNDINFDDIVSNLNLSSTNVKNFKFSDDKKEIEKKIYQLRNNKFDIIEDENDYVLYQIQNIENRDPDLKDKQTRGEIIELISQKNKFEYNSDLLKRIKNNDFNKNDFLNMGKDKIEKIELNSVKDNKKFDINAIELLYSMPVNTITLINDEKDNIYLARINSFKDMEIRNDEDNFKNYIIKQKTNNKNSILKSYDLFLNNKYKVNLNQKTIERIKNNF
jgi:peptidyl-prolyl cis-trans isomerase D